MSRQVYSEIYLHIVWRTKDSLPMIQRDIENHLYKFIKQRCAETPGVFCHAVNGTENHVHLCVSIPPALLISEWVGELKGASSHHINHKVRPNSLQWSNGYGVVSFGKNNIEFVKAYIENQKTHHATGKVHNRLEKVELEDIHTNG